MPLALSTALQFPLIIFPKENNAAILHVTPDIITTDSTAFVVHTSSGPGHYDAALLCHRFVAQNTASKCSCGINNKDCGKQTCISSAIYATRCKCFLMSQPCSPLCRCFNCCNPCGVRPFPTKKNPRKRRKHTLQVDIQSSTHFTETRGEKISEAIWSDLESIEICNEVKQLDLILKLYNDIVYYSKTSYCFATLPHNAVLRNKNVVQISAKRINLHSRQN